MTITDIAKIVHEIQVAYCQSIGETLPKWEDAPIDMKTTTEQGVIDLLHAPEAKAGYSHERWMEKKIADGWKYGPVRNWNTKEHPSIVPFSEISKNEALKDVLFVQTVRSLQTFL